MRKTTLTFALLVFAAGSTYASDAEEISASTTAAEDVEISASANTEENATAADAEEISTNATAADAGENSANATAEEDGENSASTTKTDVVASAEPETTTSSTETSSLATEDDTNEGEKNHTIIKKKKTIKHSRHKSYTKTASGSAIQAVTNQSSLGRHGCAPCGDASTDQKTAENESTDAIIAYGPSSDDLV